MSDCDFTNVNPGRVKTRTACDLVKNMLQHGAHRSSTGFRFNLMSVKQDGHSGRGRVGRSLNLPGMSKGYVNRRRAYSLSQLCDFLCLSCVVVVVVVFLLWAEFYTVCQSPERHTLEGPVEWDTRSDPSGEQLLPHLPTLSVCLSLSPGAFSLSSLSLRPSLLLHPLHIPHSVLCLLVLLLGLHQQIPRLPANFEPVRSPPFGGGYATSVGALSARVGRPRPADIPQHASQRVCN